jgi:hypothetical protein
MPEEDTVTISTVQDFFSEEYGWIGAHREYEVRAAVAEMWIADGRALPAEKKSP